MNEMELVTDVPVIEMELDVVTRNYPVIPNPEGTPTDDISSMEIDNVIYAVKDETARTELENKVDKVEGKGLSTNDFTNALKSKLDGIEAGAEVNVQSDFAQNDNTKDDFIKNKPTKLSDFDNDEGFIDKSVNNLENYYKKSETYTKSEVNSALDLKVDKVNGKGLSTNDYDDTAKGIVDNVTTNLATKVDKVEGKGLSENDYTDTDKTKLDGIEAEANKTVVDVMISPTSTNPVQNRAIYDLLNDLLPEATATGNPISITNASGLNAKSLKVELEPIQDLHGYDSPWVGGGGKNLVDKTSVTIPTGGGFIINESFANGEATQYTASLDFNTTNSGQFLFRLYSGTSVVGEATQNFSSGNTRLSVSVTASNTFDNWRLYINKGGTASKIQVAKGTETTYYPYSNICPISGRTQTTVKHYKKNLAQFTNDNRSDYHSSVTQSNNEVTVTASANFSRVRYTFPVIVGATYTLSYKGLGTSDVKRIQYGNSTASWNDSQYGSQVVTTTEATYSKTFTATTDVFALIIYNTTSSTTGTTTVKDFMLEVGDTASSYEPYVAPIDTTIPFNQTVYGGEVDVTSGGTTNKFIKENMTDLEWQKYTASAIYGNLFFSEKFVPSSYANIKVQPTNVKHLECSHFLSVVNSGHNGQAGTATEQPDGSIRINERRQIYVRDESSSTLEIFNSKISNGTLLLEVVTPTTISTPSNEISLLKGVNTLVADGDMELVYSKTPQ